jgi:hypothetical protein
MYLASPNGYIMPFGRKLNSNHSFEQMQVARMITPVESTSPIPIFLLIRSFSRIKLATHLLVELVMNESLSRLK